MKEKTRKPNPTCCWYRTIIIEKKNLLPPHNKKPHKTKKLGKDNKGKGKPENRTKIAVGTGP